MTTEQDTQNRWPITISIMLATVMNSLDTTIANVALPHIQGSVSASSDQITWVLTSYIVAAAIMTPLSGWLSDRIGRKRMFLISIGGFTVASMLCGIATSLPEIVLFRVLQGVFGAALIPLSQAVLLDINPPEKHGQAMAIWGAGAILGPILGPALGGYFTENFSWRWCFYINLPIGILAFLGVFLFISGDRLTKAKRFDFLGFGMLTLFIAAFQMVLDRGPSQDWFHSTEIWTETLLAVIGLWVFVVHTLTTDHPFFDKALIRDRNFVTASIFGFFVGILLFSTMALLPPMMQTLMGYPVLTSGLVSMPRGVGSFAAMFFVGRLIGKVDTRLILMVGLTISCVALWQMMRFDLSMGVWPFITSGIIQGLGVGLLFVPLSTLAFATVPPHLRPEGSSVYTLVRNLGSSVGISIMNGLVVANTQTMHSSLAAKIIPSDPVVRATLPKMFDPATTAGVTALNAEVTRQASMVAYVDDFRLMFIITIACMPMLLLMRKPRAVGGEPLHAAVD
ncbi:DHA2 family efflux MFS transporter permease subunit [Phenylobacterium sp.]|jgi:DHA2 family multidrug resistance protein|uniref:DHA2 family efflux MFS transporter permease subunit n=1 Tax=Phenylobacterium sp. TaxID=1871053 RepID=UPI002E378241|nr:DHA2 family efflux MFS transporter permease subunit [Phenylobacterium sp.]HEX4710944.1 DHA2 family efflux MFS transporter permease subunit [Phenylobacterium sp.]